MSYDEEQHRERRIVVETPVERREVVQHQVVRAPERRRGFSGGAVAAVALTAIALTALVFLFLVTRGDKSDETAVNVRVAQQPSPARAAATPLPATPPPVTTATVVTVPVPVPVEVPSGQTLAPASGVTVPAPATSAVDSAALQRKIDDAIRADQTLKDEASLRAVVEGAKVRLTGSVSSEDLKQHAVTVAGRIVGRANVIDETTVAP